MSIAADDRNSLMAIVVMGIAGMGVINCVAERGVVA